ncbi:MAG: hypothetical protein JNJ58_07425 [Chitinophagaceae bacterium]|nr:hypothetical protein [Chitinophagaceae bacterium]
MKTCRSVWMLAFLFLAGIQFSFAQSPQKFNYQGIARDAQGNPLFKHKLAIRLAVLPALDATSAEYEEVQEVTTNEFGLYTLQIGAGDAVNGSMKTVKWETGNKYIHVAIDPKGGNDFVDAGTTQLLSVPYALYADHAGLARETSDGTGKTRAGTVSTSAAGTGTTNYLPKFVGANTIANSQLWDNGSTVIIGNPASTSGNNRMHIYTNNAVQQTYMRMENVNTTASGRFLMANDNANSYATFTKYGTAVTGNYGGNPMYPNANLLAFGNNGLTTNDGNGRFLITNGGNIGLALTKSTGTTVKFHADFTSGNVSLGGNAAPTANIHINHNISGDTLKITNSTTGHLSTDGLDIRTTGNAAAIINRENSSLELGTNNTTQFIIDALGNTGIGTSSPTAKLDVNGQIKISGGNPAAGKVLTSDANGLATWEPAAATGITGSGAINYLSKFTPNGTTIGNSLIVDNGTNVGIGTLSPSARLTVVSASDTAGSFTSNSTNYVQNGVLRGEYIGSATYDHVGVYGRALPDSNNAYGIGVRGEGGYMGGLFLGHTKDYLIDVYGAYASGVGNADVFGISAIGLAQDTTILLGNKVGILAYAKGGLQNRGVAAVAESQSGNIAYGVKATASGTGNNYGVYATAPVAAGNYAGYFDGDVHVTGTLSKAGGTFKIDHPLDPANQYLIHSFVESPDMKNIYDGNIITDANGNAVVQLPAYFEAENKDFRYQLTVIGKDARAWVMEKISGNQFTLKTSEPNTEVSWQVTGIRKDAWAEAHRVIPEVEKTGAEKGKYLHPELFGQPATLRMHNSNIEALPILGPNEALQHKNSK